MHQKLLLLHPLFLEFQDLEITHLLQVREWEFLVRWQDLEIIHSTQHKAWQDLELQDQAHHALDQDQKAELQDLEQDQLAVQDRVQVSAERSRDLEAHHQPEDSQAEDLPVDVEEVLAVVPLVHSVKAEQEDRARLESLSAPREKNSNKEVFQALVAQLCHAVTEQLLFVYAAELQFKISQTRSMPTLVS
jgi:hypothetical protein